jgi:hypothetical protein
LKKIIYLELDSKYRKSVNTNALQVQSEVSKELTYFTGALQEFSKIPVK